MASKSPEVLASNGLDGLEDGNTTDDAVESENEKLPEENHQRECNIERTWGFSLEEIFSLALRFFKEMNGKAFSPTYEENLRLVALQKHISLGPYNPKDSPEVGFFDVLGNDRRREWERLGSMTKEDAMEDFVKLLNSCCSQFAPYVTSHKIEKEEQEKKRLREEEEHLRAEIEAQERRWQEEQCRREEEEEEMRKKEETQRREEEETQKREEAECSVMELQKKQIMEALSAQTAVQFQQYAQQQLPNSPEQQRLLIQQLQEQHYQQYIQQAYQVQQTTLQKQQDSSVTRTTPPCSGVQDSVVNPGSHSKSTQSPESNKAPKQGHLFIEGKPGEVAIMAPSMWTRPQIKEFKEKMVQDEESVITVGRGEVLTVRVSTHDDGSYLFWEFATDHYDIGFGLYFEWPNTQNGTRTDNLESPVDAQETGQDGNEKCVNPAEHGHPQLSEVVPVYRRDSHEEVYAGSHQYPGHGVYLLKFDNSYSLWRSKVVYYRVYYTR